MTQPLMNGTTGLVDMCSEPQGGGACHSDEQCSPGSGGLCIGHKCICPDGFTCADCSLSLTSLMYGLRCAMGPQGGNTCKGDGDCHPPHGRCQPVAGGSLPSRCQCIGN